MSQQQALYQWTQSVARHMPALRHSQTKVLAAFSWGVAVARRCTLRVVAEALPTVGKPDTVERRLQRFVANPRLDWQAGAAALARWVLSGLGQRKEIVLLVDETSLQEHLKVMVVSVAYRGRALPLAWWCYRQEAWPLGQVELIMTLLTQATQALPPDCRVLVQADRGLGTSPDLLAAIAAQGWYFLVRVQGQVRLRVPGQPERPFARVLSRPGQRWAGAVEAFKGAGWLPCWAVARWQGGHPQPWLLLTNWPQAHSQWYALRMWEEAAFKDLKSSAWQWQRSRIWDPAHANCLWLVLALALAWVCSLGTGVIRAPALRRELTRGHRWEFSVVQLGLRLLSRWLALGRRLSVHLVFIPHLPVLPKSVV